VATRLPYVQRAVLKIQGLCLEQIRYIAERAPQTVLFVLVDPWRRASTPSRCPVWADPHSADPGRVPAHIQRKSFPE
jgi:hypothetical protein